MNLTLLTVLGLATVFFGCVVWYALRQAKKAGVKEQVARDLETVTDAEEQIHEVQAEERGPETTKKRLRDKSF